MLLLWLLLPTQALPPPPALACLARYYDLRAERDAAGWWARLPDGRRIAYDDGQAKSFEQRLEHPDVADVFALRYHAGAITPVRAVDQDPGRVRLDAVFATSYPKSGLTEVRLLGHRLTVHRKVAPAFMRVAARLERALAADATLRPFVARLGGTFVERNIAGTDRPSAHSYGISIDINDQLAQYWRWQKPPAPLVWQNRVPQAIVDAFEAEGFIWGGRWYHYDTMHFEYRPELLDARCYAE
jgi:hypothetical protein